MFEQVMNDNRSYAESVKHIPPSGETQRIPYETTDLCIIMKEARKEELAVESEKIQRACNIIMHVIVGSSCDREEAKEHDRVSHLLERLVFLRHTRVVSGLAKLIQPKSCFQLCGRGKP